LACRLPCRLTVERFAREDASPASTHHPRMRVYGVVSEQARETVELFVELDDAEAFVAEVETDDPELAALLHVEAIEL
jgi:hypothetical protein